MTSIKGATPLRDRLDAHLTEARQRFLDHQAASAIESTRLWNAYRAAWEASRPRREG